MTIKTVLSTELSLHPKYINNNLDKSIDKLLHNKVGDKCMENGYIIGDSIKIIRRNVGNIIGSHLRGYLTFVVEFEAEIVNPMSGDEILVTVLNMNKLGIMADSHPLSVLIPRDIHDDKDIFNGIQIDDEILVSIVDKRFSINDKEIDVVARIIGPVKTEIEQEQEQEQEQEPEPEQEGGAVSVIISDMPLHIPTEDDMDILASEDSDSSILSESS